MRREDFTSERAGSVAAVQAPAGAAASLVRRMGCVEGDPGGRIERSGIGGANKA